MLEAADRQAQASSKNPRDANVKVQLEKIDMLHKRFENDSARRQESKLKNLIVKQLREKEEIEN